MRGSRIKNLVRQDYDFVIQVCQVIELLASKRSTTPLELACNHSQSIDIIETKFNMRNSAHPSCLWRSGSQ